MIATIDTPRPRRFAALDVFRGITVFLMILVMILVVAMPRGLTRYLRQGQGTRWR